MRAMDVMTTHVITSTRTLTKWVTAGAFAEHGDGGPKVRCASAAHTQPRGPQPLIFCLALIKNTK
jgi:hypothetical protein